LKSLSTRPCSGQFAIKQVVNWIERVVGDYSSALKVGGLRKSRQHAVICRMLN
jgi:hypothetical protein